MLHIYIDTHKYMNSYVPFLFSYISVETVHCKFIPYFKFQQNHSAVSEKAVWVQYIVRSNELLKYTAL